MKYFKYVCALAIIFFGKKFMQMYLTHKNVLLIYSGDTKIYENLVKTTLEAYSKRETQKNILTMDIGAISDYNKIKYDHVFLIMQIYHKIDKVKERIILDLKTTFKDRLKIIYLTKYGNIFQNDNSEASYIHYSYKSQQYLPKDQEMRLKSILRSQLHPNLSNSMLSIYEYVHKVG